MNRTLIKSEDFSIQTDNVSRITNFIVDQYFYSRELDQNRSLSNHVENFKVPELRFRDCVRFNGFVANKSIDLLKASSTEDYIILVLKDFYTENISFNEYYNYSYTVSPNALLSILPNLFVIYTTDNSLNSFENIQVSYLEKNKVHSIQIEKESVEKELTEPYNQCKEAQIDRPYHQWNCIRACIYREIKNKYNCTFPRSFFSIPRLNMCNIPNITMNTFQQEFLVGCRNECPESCYSEKFGHYITTSQTTERNHSNYTYLLFSFRDFSSLNITQIPKIDTFTFLNSIGGGLGLFMGITFPTLIEFIEFFFETLFFALFEGNII